MISQVSSICCSYVADGCINGGQLAYFSSFTIVRGVMEHHIKEFDIYLLNVFHNSFMGVLAANYKGVK